MPRKSEDKVPPISVRNLMAARGNLRESFRPYVGTLVTAEVLCAMVAPAAKVVGADGRVLLDSLSGLIGQPFTEQHLASVPARLAGNAVRLKRGIPVPVWRGQESAEWVLCHIVDVRSRSFRSKKYFCLQLLVLTGLAAGLRFFKCFPRGYLGILASDLGFGSDRWSMVPREMCRLLIRVHIERGAKLDFRRYKAVDLAYNRARIRGRKKPCPEGFRHPCWRCHMGVDRCASALNEVTLISGQCASGHTGWFDPRKEDIFCVRCRARKGRSPK